ncbi:MAG: NYN domain-containing protein [Bacteroidetes bacterium]|nr:NYN domain-containing protein [Bacteroidota bacterium]
MTHNSGIRSQATPKPRTHAAVFIDFENIYYYLKDNYADLPDLNNYLFEMLRNLQNYLERRLGLHCIIVNAYADFERLKFGPQGNLFLMGVETHNVLSTDRKNSADMKLCIDAMEVLYTRPDIEGFVFLAGDRDYIPMIQHLKRHGRSVFAVAFRGNISGDLLLNIGQHNFIDAMALLNHDLLARLEYSARRQREVADDERERDEARSAELQRREGESDDDFGIASGMNNGHDTAIDDEVGIDRRRSWPAQPRYVDVMTADFNPAIPIVDEEEQICIDVLLKHYGRHPEVWMSPYLRKLSDALPRLADYERKALLANLESAGAIRVEKRRGEPYDYSIIIVNYNHPSVRERMPGG